MFTTLARPAVSPHSACPSTSAGARHLNSGQGYQACGWIFDAETVFETIGLLEWARLAPVARVKGVMRIAEGAVRINRQGEDWHIETLSVPHPIAESSLSRRTKPTGTRSRPHC